MTAQDWDRRYSASELVWTDQANRFVVAELCDLPPGAALDLGTGEGRNAVWQAERGWRAVAVDFSRTGLAEARRVADTRGITVDCLKS